MNRLTVTLSVLLFISNIQAQFSDSISIALDLIDLKFDSTELDLMSQSVKGRKKNFKKIRKSTIPNSLPPGMVFIPPLNHDLIPGKQKTINWCIDEEVEIPNDIEELAFYPVHKLSVLIKNKQITSVELTRLFLKRLKKYGDTLQCIITITDSLAIAQAKRADAEIKAGIYRGPLHGIPYGVKDLLAVEGYKTTWGAMPYKNQYIDNTATVVKKLEEAGAVLVTKLTLGALAMGDVWYGGKTKNPWNLEQGSTGSSAGSASATAAGLVPFAIGSETWGSIVSPSTRCGVSGLRPTFGRVSRYGAMTLSWSMDKIGPICRDAHDCAIVLEIIRGEDGKDLSVRDYPYNYNGKGDLNELRVGILTSDLKPNKTNYNNDSATIQLIKSKGFSLVEKQFSTTVPVQALSIILNVESAAAFDELTVSNNDTLLVRQMRRAWPNAFRSSRLIPAVEYIQANRLRYELTLQFNTLMKDIDVLIAPTFGSQLLITNLTGHPCVVIPNGSYLSDNPGSITLIGNHFDEASILLFARYLQEITPYNEEYPPFFK